MTREEFIDIAEETLDPLLEEFRSRMQHVAILVKDYPPRSHDPSRASTHRQMGKRSGGSVLVPTIARAVRVAGSGSNGLLVSQRYR